MRGRIWIILASPKIQSNVRLCTHVCAIEHYDKVFNSGNRYIELNNEPCYRKTVQNERPKINKIRLVLSGPPYSSMVPTVDPCP